MKFPPLRHGILACFYTAELKFSLRIKSYQSFFMQKVLIRIGIVCDVVCPWSYIGKRRLEKAMELTADTFDFEIEYFPFELNPHIPDEGVDRRDYLIRKFGSELKFHELTEHVNRIAAREQLRFNLELQHTSPNTRNIHRIILFARETGRQVEVVEAFFRAYFTDAVDLTRIENLVDIAAHAGLDRNKIAQLLHSSAGKVEIEMAEKELKDLGITSVPLFIVEHKFPIAGAQSVEAFTRTFEEAAMVAHSS